jgi:hypothetical protein
VTPDRRLQAALSLLYEMLPPGSRLTTLAEYAPPSARTVLVRVLVISGDRIQDISEYVAAVLGIIWHPGRPGVTQRNYPGPGRSVAENLARRLYLDGWSCLGEDCPSAEHYGSAGAAPRQAGLTHHDVTVFRHQDL